MAMVDVDFETKRMIRVLDAADRKLNRASTLEIQKGPDLAEITWGKSGVVCQINLEDFWVWNDGLPEFETRKELPLSPTRTTNPMEAIILVLQSEFAYIGAELIADNYTPTPEDL